MQFTFIRQRISKKWTELKPLKPRRASPCPAHTGWWHGRRRRTFSRAPKKRRERFLNPDRVSMPDIDVDFSDAKREKVIEYVRQKYGSESVSQIITFGTLSSRA
ncbi:MAG: hypothetical protein NTZ29_17010, partial [Verrucomicrobia bacterium]|nr:hypothetical protein [Verrucomicrobiota bacterium]